LLPFACVQECTDFDAREASACNSRHIEQHTHSLEYDHIVFALGCVTNFFNIPSLHERAQVIRVIDGPLAPISCVSQTAYERCSCPDEEHCGWRMLMLDVRSAIANILDRYTSADVLEVTLRKLRKSRMSHPFFPGTISGRVGITLKISQEA
jgi:hypothetical protein